MTETPEMGLSAALRSMMDRGAVEHPTRLIDLNMRANREGAHPNIIKFADKMQNHFAKLGIPLFAHNMVRNKEEQTALFVRGVSKAKWGQSPHNFGLAVDLITPHLAWDGMTPDAWKMLGHLGKEVAKRNNIRIIWGGDWKFYDPAHWELAQWENLKGGYPWPAPPKLTSPRQ